MSWTVESSVEMLAAVYLLVTGLSHILQPRTWARFFIMLREKGEVGSFLMDCYTFRWERLSSRSILSGGDCP